MQNNEEPKLTNRIYAKNGLGYNIYPEFFHPAWFNKLDVISESKRWQGKLGVERNMLVAEASSGLNDAERNAIADNATTREDFHDYQWYLSKDGGWSTCLCELRIATGQDCLKHLEKGKYEIAEAGEPPKNKHWAYIVDNTPRGKVCPKAQYMSDGALGNPPVDHQACDNILIKAPPEHWVLAQRDCDPDGTVAGRASTDVVLPGPCYACQGVAIRAEDNRAFPNQLDKFRPKERGTGKDTAWTLPMRYMPLDERLEHPTLEYARYYHKERLLGLHVNPKHIYDIRRGMTLAAIEAEQEAIVQAQIAASAALVGTEGLHGPPGSYVP